MDAGPRHNHGLWSWLSDGLDRAAIGLYFVGAVLPLVGFAVVLDRFALPSLDSRTAEVALVAVLVCFTGLTLGAFLALRRVLHGALARMDRDNQRLSGLLEWSRAIASALHVTDVLTAVVERAREMADADAAYVFLKGTEGDAPALASSAGEDADRIYTTHAGGIEELAVMAAESGRPAVRTASNGDIGAAAVPLSVDANARGALAVFRTGRARIEPGELDALSTLAGLSTVALHNADLRDAQRNFFSHVTDLLVTALDTHLGFHHGHGERVARLANRLGRAVGFDDAALERLHCAALLHDIGMLKLDRDQQMTRATCDAHTVLGYRMLTRIRLWREIAPVVYHHHEWFDGNGYPDGKAGDAIPRESRVIAVCDAFDSMTADSSYRSPLSSDAALAELEGCAGTQFDPGLVAAFVGLARNGGL